MIFGRRVDGTDPNSVQRGIAEGREARRCRSSSQSTAPASSAVSLMVDEAVAAVRSTVALLPQRLLREGREPVDQQRSLVGCIGLAHPARRRLEQRLTRSSAEDALGRASRAAAAPVFAAQAARRRTSRLPGARRRTPGSRRRSRRPEPRALSPRAAGDNELCGGVLSAAPTRRRALLREPERVLREARRMVTSVPCDPEDQVVARLIGRDAAATRPRGRQRDLRGGERSHEDRRHRRRNCNPPARDLDRTIALNAAGGAEAVFVHLLAAALHRRADARGRRVRSSSTANAAGQAGDDRRPRRGRSRSDDEARAIARAYRDVFETIERAGLDSNIECVKPTGLGLKLDYDLCRENLGVGSSATAARRNNFVRIDMEDSSTTDDTLALYRELREGGSRERRRRAAGLPPADARRHPLARRPAAERPALQGHLRRAAGARVHQDYDASARELRRRASTRCSTRTAYVGIATHDEWLDRRGRRIVARRGLGRDEYEFQMLLGVRRAARRPSSSAKGIGCASTCRSASTGTRTRCARLQENPKIAGYVARGHAGAACASPQRLADLGERAGLPCRRTPTDASCSTCPAASASPRSVTAIRGSSRPGASSGSSTRSATSPTRR